MNLPIFTPNGAKIVESDENAFLLIFAFLTKNKLKQFIKRFR
jgi:hypothetical protein